MLAPASASACMIGRFSMYAAKCIADTPLKSFAFTFEPGDSGHLTPAPTLRHATQATPCGWWEHPRTTLDELIQHREGALGLLQGALAGSRRREVQCLAQPFASVQCSHK